MILAPHLSLLIMFRSVDMPLLQKARSLTPSEGGLREHELSSHLAGDSRNEANPMRTEGIGEEDRVVVAADESYSLVFNPGAIAEKVDLNLYGSALF